MFTPTFKFPSECLTLVHSRNSFVFEGWEKALENVPVFRVSGINDALARLKLEGEVGERIKAEGRRYIQPLRVISDTLDARIPKKWKQFYQTQGAWSPLGEPQIKKVENSSPQPFDRALMSIVYVADFIERVLHERVPDDYLDIVSVVPVVYYFDVGKKFWEKIEKADLVVPLYKALGHQNEDIIRQALEDRCRMTWRTASLIQTFLAKEGIETAIECSRSKNPKAIANEPLYLSRKVEHPSVRDYMGKRAG